ncbi:MAG: UDP-N-acetylglucosamine 2-epimerase (non-hydrolyzing) [Anaerolineales bacterium]|nr:UDP-N-acetylglucosamine 2-epimerase (non-hydrolyzing) [Anaerolineales bacterium]
MSRSNLRVLSIFGTRPEAVKMAPVIKRLSKTPGVNSLVCVTAQHREMLDQVLDLFRIVTDYDLNLMRHDQSLAELTASVFTDLDAVIRRTKPDWILAQGDTTTVMAAALLAYYNKVQVGHVEAGLRTDDKWQPYPEEINRRVAGVVADLHFAPTEWARDNLLAEGIPMKRVVVTGNPVIDALYWVIEQPYDLYQGPLKDVPEDKRIVLITAHRRENFGEPLKRVFQALREIAYRYADDILMIYPVHLNPNVYGPAHNMLGDVPNIRLTEPLDYLPMAHLIKRAHLVLTDSGGLQEEAPALGTPVLVLRQVTERPEAIQAGTARLVGTDQLRIVGQASILLDNPKEHNAMAKAVNPFGDGHAAERIVSALLDASRDRSGI